MSKKQEIKDPLNVDQALSSSEAYLERNQNKLLGGIAAIVLVVLAVIGYKNFISEPKELSASEAIFQAEEYFRLGQYEEALNGDTLGTEGFLTIADKYSGTNAGNLACAYAGISLAQTGRYDDAVKYLEDFSGDDLVVAPAVVATLGNCYAQTGKLDKAAQLLKDAASQADSQALSPVYLIQAGQIYEKLGKYDEALNVYNQVKNRYGNSYAAMQIDKYIERATLK